ncbi:MAG: hypothetical protein HY748_09375 [Elusimicrobia bacterium]|nr:hypothetical protein [Elusimicrobiota bacterium]
MVRTQIFLTRQEYEQLKRLARLKGQSYSSILRGYLDQALGISSHQEFLDALDEVAGSVPRDSLSRSVRKSRTLW